MIKINMGCGKRNFGPDWVHIDGGDHPHLNSKNINKLPYDDNTVDLIYASHVIEYFDRHEVLKVLNEWKRTLKPGGTLRLAVPCYEKLNQFYHDGTFTLDRLLGALYGRMPMGDEMIYHKTVYDFASLKKVLESGGFKNIRRWDWRKVEHSQFDDFSQAYYPHMDKENGTHMSLNVECDK